MSVESMHVPSMFMSVLLNSAGPSLGRQHKHVEWTAGKEDRMEIKILKALQLRHRIIFTLNYYFSFLFAFITYYYSYV